MNEAEARRLLTVKETASMSELKSAYHRTLKTWHPDLFDTDSALYARAISHTQRINAAYQLLRGDSGKREDVSYAPPLPEWIKEPILTSRSETILVWGALILLLMLWIIVEVLWRGAP